MLFVHNDTRELFLAWPESHPSHPILVGPAPLRLKELGGSDESAGVLESVLKTVGKATDQAIQRHGNLAFSRYGVFFRHLNHLNIKDQIRSELS